MEQGLRLLIQLIIEFAPVIATLVQKNNEAPVGVSNKQKALHNQALIQSGSDYKNTFKNTFKNTSKDTSKDNYKDNYNQKVSYIQGFEKESIEQQKLAVYDRQSQLKIATIEQTTVLQLPELQKLFESWPLRLYPSQILANDTNNTRKPLKIFLAPPKVEFDKFAHQQEENLDIELMLAEGLRDFISQHYSLQNPVRPTEFLAGAWDSKRFHSESSIKALFGMLQTEPILILESELDGDYLNFRIAYWGLGQDNYYYKTISRLPYKNIIYQSVKNNALEWKKVREELISLGEESEEINNLGGDNVINLAILEKIEKWKSKGIDISKLSLQYQVNRQNFEQLCQVLITCHCLVASWIADAYHLVYHDVSPLLPDLLPNLLESDLDLPSLQAIIAGYQQLYQALEAERLSWIPELALQLAQSLSHLSDRSLAQEQVDYSINAWLRLRQVSPQQWSKPWQAMRSVVKLEDEEYIQKLKEYFVAVGDSQIVTDLEEILCAITNLKRQRQEEYVSLNHTLTGNLGKVTSIAISPDGETLIGGCADKNIKIWNIKTGVFIRNLTKNSGEISSVAVSNDGNLLVVGSYETPRSNVKVWHLKTGKLIHTLLGHHKPVNVVAISPISASSPEEIGQLLASGGNKIKVWNLHKGNRISTLWHSSVVNTIAISPVNPVSSLGISTILVSGTRDKKIRLWDPHTGELLRTLSGHFGEVNSVAISAVDVGEILFSGSADKTIKVWELETGKILHTLTGHTDEVKSVAISPNGELLVSGSADNTIKIWRWKAGELLQTLTAHSETVNQVVISPDNQYIASCSSDKTIKIWQLNHSM